MDWFLYDMDFRHERVKLSKVIQNYAETENLL